MVKNRPKWWLPVAERILGGIISAEGIAPSPLRTDKVDETVKREYENDVATASNPVVMVGEVIGILVLKLGSETKSRLPPL